MQRSLAVAAAMLLAVQSALALEASNRVLTKLPGSNKTAPYFSVKFVDFTIGGEKQKGVTALKMFQGEPAAMATKLPDGTEGLPVLQADYDSVTVTVAKNTNATAPMYKCGEGVQCKPSSVAVFACYAKTSLYDRGWRKPNVNTELDKQCYQKIKGDMPVTGGLATYVPSPNTPKSVMFLRAYLYCDAEGMDEPIVCAYGNSPGVVAIHPIQTHPANLIGAAIACIFCGPLCLVGFYIYESKVRKDV